MTDKGTCVVPVLFAVTTRSEHCTIYSVGDEKRIYDMVLW